MAGTIRRTNCAARRYFLLQLRSGSTSESISHTFVRLLSGKEHPFITISRTVIESEAEDWRDSSRQGKTAGP